MIPVFLTVSNPLLNPCGQLFVVSTLSLCQDVLLLASNSRGMFDDFSIRSCEIDFENPESIPISPNATSLNLLRLCVYEQAEIPTRCTFDHATALDFAIWNVHLVEADTTQTRQSDAITFRSLDGVRKRNAGEFVPHSFKTWLASNLLEATLPRIVHSAENSLQCVRWNLQPLPVVSQKVLKRLLAEK